jgi:hypothetical protein
MKVKNVIYLFLSCSLFLFSCKKEDEVETPKSAENIVIPRVQSLPIQETVATTPQTNVTPQPQTVNPAQVATQNPVNTKGMNPAHGQAGHRCDIAVGAPLNSPITKPPVSAGKPATITQSTNAVNTATNTIPSILKTNGTTPTTPVVTAPGMNPPHGQDGHKCDIAVGAPLPK